MHRTCAITLTVFCFSYWNLLQVGRREPSSGGLAARRSGYKSIMPDQPHADPQDSKFGREAAEKEVVLDEALKRGDTPEQLDAKDADLRRRGVTEKVRPGGKAKPVVDRNP